jgi:hypothetical protein
VRKNKGKKVSRKGKGAVERESKRARCGGKGKVKARRHDKGKDTANKEKEWEPGGI